MANRKQRRRREKEKRHAYEIVEIDAEGNETVLDSAELRPEPSRNGKGRGKGKGKGSKSSPRGRQAQQGRSRRQPVQEPSWSRVGKRGLMFAPVFFVVVYLLGGDGMTITGLVVQTLLLLVVFIPFSYFMDRLMWRAYQRRSAKGGEGSK